VSSLASVPQQPSRSSHASRRGLPECPSRGEHLNPHHPSLNRQQQSTPNDPPLTLPHQGLLDSGRMSPGRINPNPPN
jgi:hypothetical protein